MKYFELQIRGRCGWIWLGQSDANRHKVLPELLKEWEKVWSIVEKNDAIEAVILSSRQKNFMVETDLGFLFDINELGVWKPYGRRIHKLLQKIEVCSKPVIAAINGDCKGIGFELALTCHYRLTVSNVDCFLLFSGAKLGLLPFGGATQRLPRLIGIRAALEMLVDSKEVNVYEAKAIGLVDQLVHPHQLELVAQQQALGLIGKSIVRKPKLSRWDRWMENTALGRSMMLDEARQKLHRYTYGNYPALLKIIECVEVGYMYDVKLGYELELKSMDEVVTHPITKQLINTYFAVKAKRENPLAKDVRSVRKLGIVGAGEMGEMIARESLLKGFEVVLNDLSEQTLSQSQARIWRLIAKMAKKRLLTPNKQAMLMTRLQTTTDYPILVGVDLVVQAVFENLDLKQQVLAESVSALSTHCIYAINTSAITISDVAQYAENPSQVIGMRYFSPILKSSLLEIVVTKLTAKWVIATAIDVGIRQGKTPIVVKDTPGFYTTRILAVLLNEALLLLEEGGDILQVDEAAKQLGFSKGVFELIDEMGIDVGAHIMSGTLLQFFRKRHENRHISMGLLDLYNAGYRGRKNLNGFYSYHSKTGKRRVGRVDEDVYDFFGGAAKERLLFKTKQIRQRLMMTVVNEAAYCLQEDTIFSPQDGDLGAILGLGFPAFTGGPFRYLDSLGAEKALKRLNKLQEKFGVRFTPAFIIEELAIRGETFYR
ncbi:MAG: 3-hydroxyacyl-CoA dehydrogenase NAD-binding domain-containing protein [Chitinophagales bacterium]